MIKNSKNFIGVDDLNTFNYNETKKNVEQLFSKYRSFKMKEEIIEKRYKSALSLDNLGIFSSTTSDPVGNKVEMPAFGSVQQSEPRRGAECHV